jgi:hypothetical protein
VCSSDLGQCYVQGVQPFCGLFTRDASGQINDLRRGNANLGQIETEGMDLSWTYRLPDMEAAPVVVEPPAEEGSSVGTGPGHYGKRPRLWIEDHAKRVVKPTWPNLPDVKSAPPWNPKVVTRDTHRLRPRIDAIQREWKTKMRRAREADDAIIAMIIAMILAEEDK